MRRSIILMLLIAMLFAFSGNAQASIYDLDDELASVFYRDIEQGGIMESFRELAIANGYAATEFDRAIAQAVSQARKDGLTFYIDPKLGGTPELRDQTVSNNAIIVMIVMALAGFVVAKKHLTYRE